jgi:hypothetical protein
MLRPVAAVDRATHAPHAARSAAVPRPPPTGGDCGPVSARRAAPAAARRKCRPPLERKRNGAEPLAVPCCRRGAREANARFNAGGRRGGAHRRGAAARTCVRCPAPRLVRGCGAPLRCRCAPSVRGPPRHPPARRGAARRRRRAARASARVGPVGAPRFVRRPGTTARRRRGQFGAFLLTRAPGCVVRPPHLRRRHAGCQRSGVRRHPAFGRPHALRPRSSRA